MDPVEREEQAVRAYVLSQSSKREKITHAEKIAARRIYGEAHDIWDVWTSKDRWWVITNPTNLYRQADFMSLEVAFTYHLGVAVVLAHRNAPPEEDDEVLRIAGSWRRLREAREELNNAIEAEDYQAVGVRCREALLSMVGDLQEDSMVPAGAAAPKKGDFGHWSELIADHVAGGAALADVRSHLKHTAKSAWALVGWLTHAKHAGRTEAGLVIEATEHVLSAYVGETLGALRRAKRYACPRCGSYEVMPEWDPTTYSYTGRVLRCDACGYGQPEPPRPVRRRRPTIK